MPITKSAKKALRQSLRRKEKNLEKKVAIKRAIKDYKNLLGSKKLDEAKTKLWTAYKALDKAAKAKTITKNKASRLKSRLAKKLSA